MAGIPRGHRVKLTLQGRNTADPGNRDHSHCRFGAAGLRLACTSSISRAGGELHQAV